MWLPIWGYPIHSKCYLLHIAIFTRLALWIQPKDLGGQLTFLPQMIVKDAAIVYSDGMTPVAFHVLWPPRLPALSDAIILSSPKEISDGLAPIPRW